MAIPPPRNTSVEEFEELQPPVRDRPCAECPWRRSAAPGWLGPMDAAQWLVLADSDLPIACHTTIVESEHWRPGTLQCAGAAIFRANNCKLPRGIEGVAVGERDPENVFSRGLEFLQHHAPDMSEEEATEAYYAARWGI